MAFKKKATKKPTKMEVTIDDISKIVDKLIREHCKEEDMLEAVNKRIDRIVEAIDKCKRVKGL